MTKIIIIGGGIGGVSMAYEIRCLLGKENEVMLVSDSETFHFVPSNPWVAVNWRKPSDIKVELEPYLNKKNISFRATGVKRVYPDENHVVLRDGSSLPYDYLVIATGSRLAFNEIEGLGPEGYTQSVCHVDHAKDAAAAWDKFIQNPGPVVVGAAQGASCFGPAYEFALIMEMDLRKRRLRDQVPMTYVTPEPYIGHLGLGGVGDSKAILESLLRERHIKWITNANVEKIENGTMYVLEHNEDGSEKQRHQLPFDYSMMLPAFTGIEAVSNIDGLTNPRGFINIDKYQRNPRYENIYAVGVCVAIAPLEKTAVPVGVPKTGYMIESMVTAAALNIRDAIEGKIPSSEATWNAVCLADMGDTGVAFIAMPQIPPRNVTWTKSGKWVHLAKIAYEKYFLHKVRKGTTEPLYEHYILKLLGINKLK
jgi:sulfide:quinone oxidoreductase